MNQIVSSFSRAMALFEKNDYKNAIAEFEKILDVEHYREKAHYFTGLSYVNQNNFERAAPFLQKVIEVNPENHQALNLSGMCHFRAKNLSKALYYHKKASELAPYEPLYMENIAHVLWKEKKLEEALLYFHKALELNSESPEIAMYICYIYNERGDLKKSDEYFRKALKRDASHPMVEEWHEEHELFKENIYERFMDYLNNLNLSLKKNYMIIHDGVINLHKDITFLYRKNRDFLASLFFYSLNNVKKDRKILPLFTFLIILLSLSILFYNIADKQTHLSKSPVRTVLSEKFSPENEILTYIEKHLKLFEEAMVCKNYKAAEEELYKLAEKGFKKSDRYVELGEKFFNSKDYANSAECFEEVLTMEPEHLKALKILDLSYREMKKYDRVISVNKKILSLLPSDSDASLNIALAFNRKNDYLSSVKWFKKALCAEKTEKKKNYITSMIGASLLKEGNIMIEKKKYKEGAKLFKESLSFKKNDPSAKKGLAICYLYSSIELINQKKYKEGKDFLNKVIALEPGEKLRREAESYLNIIKVNTQIVYKQSIPEKEITVASTDYIENNKIQENISETSVNVKKVKPQEIKEHVDNNYDDIKLKDNWEESKL